MSKNLRQYSEPVLRTFFCLCRDWGVSDTQAMTILGLEDKYTFNDWKEKPEEALLSDDTFERLSYVFGIYKALQILIPDPKIADQWILTQNSNPLFNGQAPLDRILSGQVSDLYLVRRYLDEWCL